MDRNTNLGAAATAMRRVVPMEEPARASARGAIAGAPGRPLKVGVLVDLEYMPQSRRPREMLAASRRSGRRDPRRAGPYRPLSTGRENGNCAVAKGAVCAVAAGVQYGAAGAQSSSSGPHRYRAVASATGASARALRRDPHDRRVFLLCSDGDAVRAHPWNPGGQFDPHQHARIRAHHGGKDAATPARDRFRLSCRVRISRPPELGRLVPGASSREASRLRDRGRRVVCWRIGGGRRTRTP